MKTVKNLRLLAMSALLLSGAIGAVQAQTVLKIGYATSPTSHYGVGTTVFCEEIEKGTSGRYSCQQFPSSALGGEREMIESVQLGTLDLVNTSTGPLGNFVPETRIVDIPFLFRDYDHAKYVADSLATHHWIYGKLPPPSDELYLMKPYQKKQEASEHHLWVAKRNASSSSKGKYLEVIPN